MSVLLDPAGQKLISIMIPSRNRMEKLISCLETFSRQLGETGRKEVEFVIKFDSDDTASLSRIPEINAFGFDLKIVISSGLRGYRDLFYFYNQCARLTTGQFLLMWNDDAHFQTEDWYPQFKAEAARQQGALSYWFGGTPTLVKIPGEEPRTEDWPCFIAHHRLLYHIVGFYGHQGGVDSFLYYVLGPLGALKKLDQIKINHQAWFQIPEQERDQISQMNGARGAMLPTNFDVVRQCQQRILSWAQKSQTAQKNSADGSAGAAVTPSGASPR